MSRKARMRGATSSSRSREARNLTRPVEGTEIHKTNSEPPSSSTPLISLYWNWRTSGTSSLLFQISIPRRSTKSRSISQLGQLGNSTQAPPSGHSRLSGITLQSSSSVSGRSSSASAGSDCAGFTWAGSSNTGHSTAAPSFLAVLASECPFPTGSRAGGLAAAAQGLPATGIPKPAPTGLSSSASVPNSIIAKCHSSLLMSASRAEAEDKMATATSPPVSRGGGRETIGRLATGSSSSRAPTSSGAEPGNAAAGVNAVGSGTTSGSALGALSASTRSRDTAAFADATIFRSIAMRRTPSIATRST
mmetsp:Transcript_86118/g.230591  ORF Transcript_86118/g.230591 Transcript_86118/m.230591 type:complete len:305 (-) Transcript_86118:2028-2942(-)